LEAVELSESFVALLGFRVAFGFTVLLAVDAHRDA
jgi:hypothetical protein